LIALEESIFFIAANFGPFLALAIVGGEKQINYAKSWVELEINNPGLNGLIKLLIQAWKNRNISAI